MIEAPVIIKKTSNSRGTLPEFSFGYADLPLGENQPINKLREDAWKVYKTLPFPTENDEAWRRTNLSGLKASEYRFCFDKSEVPVIDKELLHPLAGDILDGQVVVQPHRKEASLAEIYVRQGVIFAPYKQAIENYPEIVQKKIGSIVPASDGKFAAQNTAFAQNGILLYVPAGVKIEHPLHSILWAGGNLTSHFTRVLVWLDEGAEATLVHEYASSQQIQEQLFHNGVVEVYAGANSHLKMVELQSWGKEVWNITHQRIIAHENAQVEWIFGALGSKTTKDFTDFNMAGQGAMIKASGFYFTEGNQHFDHDTQQNHLVPNTTSDLLYKGAMTGKSRSVWQGMIYVAPGAQKTDGYQANRNLVLSGESRADSIPGLEILADDVRCTHGATVGKIDSEQIYYLMARGLPEIEAKRLIVEGFFEPIMDRIPFEGVQDRFRHAIQQKMNTISI
jgi:Fe-S cluster assembly protein SufD